MHSSSQTLLTAINAAELWAGVALLPEGGPATPTSASPTSASGAPSTPSQGARELGGRALLGWVLCQALPRGLVDAPAPSTAAPAPARAGQVSGSPARGEPVFRALSSRIPGIRLAFVQQPGWLIDDLAADLPRIREIMRDYRDLRADFTDASLVALSERLRCTEAATTDRRDFSVYRPRHAERLTNPLDLC